MKKEKNRDHMYAKDFRMHRPLHTFERGYTETECKDAWNSQAPLSNRTLTKGYHIRENAVYIAFNSLCST